MIDFLLFLIILALLVHVWFLTEQYRKEKDKLLEELSRAIKALISKNATEYVMTTSIDKVDKEPKEPAQEEGKEVSQLEDDEFDAMIDRQNGKEEEE